MQIRALLRTTTFRLSALYGLIFALALVALLGLVYLRSAVYLTRRVDGILTVEADALQRAPPASLRGRVEEALTLSTARATTSSGSSLRTARGSPATCRRCREGSARRGGRSRSGQPRCFRPRRG
jgi:hypothetical protein